MKNIKMNWFKKLLKLNMNTNQQLKQDLIQDLINSCVEDFQDTFKKKCKESDLDVPELTDEILESVVRKFFSIEKYKDASTYINTFVDNYVEGDYDKINHKLPYEEKKLTPEYLAWMRQYNIQSLVYSCTNKTQLFGYWVDIHGQAHTDEEAATIAANKWGELLFNFHLQDNGALNEEHSFNASLLATYLGEMARDEITEEVKVNVINLFKEYYLHYINYSRNPYHRDEDLNWCKENLPDPEGKFEWDLMCEPYCDYGPNTILYLILLNGGVPNDKISNICPWKTGIGIRIIDNMVLYHTYQKQEEL